MKVSIIVATFNRASLLAECLGHLSLQRFEEGDEVIVVDNGSTDETPATIDAAVAAFGVPLHHLRESTPGKSHALAAATAAAKGDVLAFTDDDVHVGLTWLSKIRSVMVDESIALVGGPVFARRESRAPNWLRRASEGTGRLAAPLGLLNYGSVRMDLAGRTALGANLAIRRHVLIRTGGFPTDLGKLRGTLLTGEDHDLCRRVEAGGFRATYDPGMPVYHWVPAERMRLRYYMSWFFWSGITHASLDGRPAGRSILGVPLFIYRRFAVSAVRAPAALIAGGLDNAIEDLVDVAFAAGYARGRWRLAPPMPLLHVFGGPA